MLWLCMVMWGTAKKSSHTSFLALFFPDRTKAKAKGEHCGSFFLIKAICI